MQDLTESFFSQLDSRQREIIYSRYGLFGFNKQTLEQLGNKYGITRERIRQIEEKSLSILRQNIIYSLPEYFSNKDPDFNKYLLLNNVFKFKYKKLSLNRDFELYLTSNLYKQVNSDILKFRNTTLLNRSYSTKESLFKNILRSENLPEDLIAQLVTEVLGKKLKGDYIYEILFNNGIPMHYSEIYKLLPDNLNIDNPRNVLAELQRRPDLYVRKNNGLYDIKKDNNDENVQFIKDLIIEYLKQYKESNIQNIYNYIVQHRQCKFNSIVMYLSLCDEFEEVREGIYSLRDVQKNHDTNTPNLSELLSTSAEKSIDDVVSSVLELYPEISIIDLHKSFQKMGYKVVNNKLIKYDYERTN